MLCIISLEIPVEVIEVKVEGDMSIYCHKLSPGADLRILRGGGGGGVSGPEFFKGGCLGSKSVGIFTVYTDKQTNL